MLPLLFWKWLGVWNSANFELMTLAYCLQQTQTQWMEIMWHMHLEDNQIAVMCEINWNVIYLCCKGK